MQLIVSDKMAIYISLACKLWWWAAVKLASFKPHSKEKQLHNAKANIIVPLQTVY